MIWSRACPSCGRRSRRRPAECPECGSDLAASREHEQVDLERVFAGNDLFSAQRSLAICVDSGMRAELLTYDDSGMRPNLGFVTGYWLLVRADDAARAIELVGLEADDA